MRSYTDGSELNLAIQAALQKYLKEFANIPGAMKDYRAIEGDKTPSEHLSYQLGWVNLLLQWEQDEQAGNVVHTPMQGYQWNNLGDLYQYFYAAYGQYTLFEQQQMLKKSVAEIGIWVVGLNNEELFQPEQRQWASNRAKWPLWKWVHINTVAPFTNFRGKIRKWKKIALAGG
ncbi:cytoplasmic protein [Chelonobacter oris]|uniref:ClbS/DfsB family four-helix bundle protein n=1 Tax=Chelonobacter oris TaxID=505317 RepID=UPI0024470862|nr:ClbS/DfsB family four-helix bundle protein [Chelonobacter oris]MDH2999905.1 cytoplasmic protein [Chelonobacter oris]